MIRSYKDLRVWHKAYQLCLLVYEYTAGFPKEERYGLSQQMRRAVISIPSNIAEGYCRHSRKEYSRYIDIAFGSGAELETQTKLSIDLKMGKVEEGQAVISELDQILRMLNVLSQSLKNPRP